MVTNATTPATKLAASNKPVVTEQADAQKAKRGRPKKKAEQ